MGAEWAHIDDASPKTEVTRHIDSGEGKFEGVNSSRASSLLRTSLHLDQSVVSLHFSRSDWIERGSEVARTVDAGQGNCVVDSGAGNSKSLGLSNYMGLIERKRVVARLTQEKGIEWSIRVQGSSSRWGCRISWPGKWRTSTTSAWPRATGTSHTRGESRTRILASLGLILDTVRAPYDTSSERDYVQSLRL